MKDTAPLPSLEASNRAGCGSKGCGVLGCFGTFFFLAAVFAGLGVAGQLWLGAISVALSVTAGFGITEMARRRRLGRQ